MVFSPCYQCAFFEFRNAITASATRSGAWIDDTCPTCSITRVSARFRSRAMANVSAFGIRRSSLPASRSVGRSKFERSAATGCARMAPRRALLAVVTAVAAKYLDQFRPVAQAVRRKEELRDLRCVGRGISAVGRQRAEDIRIHVQRTFVDSSMCCRGSTGRCRSGCRAASTCAIRPPSEVPITWARSWPRPRIRAAASSARSASE